MPTRVKEIVWIGSTLKDLRRCPQQVRKDIGKALYAAQCGETDPSAKPLAGFGGTHVMEIIERYRTDSYRAVYAARLANAVYVLHVFQKKAKKGRETPKQDMALIRGRLAEATRDSARRQN